MRVQNQIVIFILCLNVALAMVDAFGSAVIPGTGYGYSGPPSDNGSALGTYTSEYNATDVAANWQPPSVLTAIGDIVWSLPKFFIIMLDIVAGFPLLLIRIGAMFAFDATAGATWLVFCGGLGAIFGYMMVTFILELISGRPLND